LGTATTVLSFMGGIGAFIGFLWAALWGVRQFWLNQIPWTIHFQNRLEEKPKQTNNLILYPGLNIVFVELVAKVPIDYSLGAIRIATKPRRLVFIWENALKLLRNRRMISKIWVGFKEFVQAPPDNPPKDFFVQMANICDNSPLREEFDIQFIAQPSKETGITWWLGYNPPYKLPARSPVWLYLNIEVGSIPKSERGQMWGIQFTSGVAGQRRPIFRRIEIIKKSPITKDA